MKRHEREKILAITLLDDKFDRVEVETRVIHHRVVPQILEYQAHYVMVLGRKHWARLTPGGVWYYEKHYYVTKISTVAEVAEDFKTKIVRIPNQ